MTLKFNPLSGELDYFLHQGMASYKFTGWTELEELVDPGVGNVYFNMDAFGFGYAVVSTTDNHGYDMAYNLEMMFFALSYYDCFLYFHGKTNSDRFIGFIVIPDEAWIDVVDEEENLLAWGVPIWPVFFSMTYDAELDEFTIEEFPDNSEVLMHIDLAFNPDYFGTMADQDYDSVGISGGSISGTNLYSPPILELPVKVDTGDPEFPNNGRIYVNAFDKKVRLYINDAWETVFDFS